MNLYPPGIVIRDFAYDSDHELATGIISSAFDVDEDGDGEYEDDVDYDDEEEDNEDDEAYYESEEAWDKVHNVQIYSDHKENDNEHRPSAHAEGEEKEADDDDDDDELYGTDEINRRAVALFDFIPENDNEVALIEGQLIWISYRHGQGWLVAEDPTTGKNGLVPEEYVEVYRDYDEEIVFEQLPPPPEQNHLYYDDDNAETEQQAQSTTELRVSEHITVSDILEGVAGVAL
ncbi:HOG (high osmolarity glycerol) pathway protein [Scheffersomyces spartinae]|uniref:HOG (High osmolarity glycerol) pathway protein n=1 Tax=Scheffersomyces spartinae TaxID=45513 RepID=A0A9P7V7A2_9ASCO|nr:HOG (high osmolarity glycerol) pathway protein [Scheffersomyces spartinae]KAG7192683.1 HOG (high osmolarity glycerol) pathway protein [Scheffersomyces spartinae]